MGLGSFRRMKLMNMAVCVSFCLNFVLSGLAFAQQGKDARVSSMLRQPAASGIASAQVSSLLAMGVEMLKNVFEQKGQKGLEAKLADLSYDGAPGEKLENTLYVNDIRVLTKGADTYIVSLLDNGWKCNLSHPKVKIEPFASEEERDNFISGFQLTWLAGEYTPREIIDAQAGTKRYLQDAGDDKRIFVNGGLDEQVNKYSAQKTSVDRQLPPLDAKGKKALVERLQKAFDFVKNTISSISQEDVDKMVAVGLPSGLSVKVGAQGFSLWGGAAVEKITTDHLQEVGIRDSIVGHSATRATEIYVKKAEGDFVRTGFQKGDETSDIHNKLGVALQKRLKVTYCVGETLYTREVPKNHIGFVKGQLETGLGALGLTGEQALALLEAVAYEPIWAIGTGVTAKPEQVAEMHQAIYDWLAEKYGAEVASRIPIQYGGSVKAENEAEIENTRKIFELAHVDGALVGGASLKAKSFLNIAKVADSAGKDKGKKMLVSANWKAEESNKRDVFNAHLKELAGAKLGNVAINYYLPHTLLSKSLHALIKARSPNVKDVVASLEKTRHAIILDEDGSPSFYYKGKAGTSRYTAVTMSSGGYKYEGYDFDQTGAAPRSIYESLDIIESYMKLSKEDSQALDAYQAKLLHEYFEVSTDSKFHRKESKEVTELINKYDLKALNIWKEQEAKKAKARLDRENKKVVAEVTSVNIAKFLDSKFDEVIPQEVIKSVENGLQALVVSGLLTDYRVFANGGDIHMLTTRQNRNALIDDARLPGELVKIFVAALDELKAMNAYRGEDLKNKSYAQQARSLELRVPYVPLKYSERTADPFAVFNASNTYAGAFNLAIWEILNNPMYNAGLTIDPTATRGYIFEIWDSIEDKVNRFDAQTENQKLRALANQPGRYVIVAVYPKAEHKVAADEPLLTVSVKRVADDGKSQVFGDFSPVLMLRSQSGLPAWGELIAPIGTAMPVIAYGGDKTKGIVAMRPTHIEQANAIPASKRKGISVFTGFGFQSHDNGHIGKNEDIGGHQSLDPARENAESWAKLFYNVPEYMDHVTKLEPFLRPHTYNRQDKVVETRERLDGRFKVNPDPKKNEDDPLLNVRKDYAISNIKADIGSVPGHFKPHPVLIRSLNDMLEIGKVYGFAGVKKYIDLGNALMLLRTGMTIDEVAGKNGIYRKDNSDALMMKVRKFKDTVKITSWDEAIEYVRNRPVDKSFEAGLKDAILNTLKAFNGETYQYFMKEVETASEYDARRYLELADHRAPTDKEVAVLATMIGLTAGSAKELFDTSEALRVILGIDRKPGESESIIDYTVWSVGDDCQLTMKHRLMAEDKSIHTLAWNALWYASDQASYFKDYGHKQDILVDKLVSGNIQGAGPGYAELQLRDKEDEGVLVFSADKCAPGAFTAPILGMIRMAISQGKFRAGVIAEIWDINNSQRAFLDLTDPEDFQDALSLLSSPEEFAIKRVWTARKPWNKIEPIDSVIEDIPLIAASTERLVLTAGEYTGKDDPTIEVRISRNPNERLDKEEVNRVFQFPQITLGFMRGSHVGPLVPGTEASRFSGKADPSEFKPEATPHFFDGPPPVAGLDLIGGRDLSQAQDIFEKAPWLQETIKNGNFISQVLRRQGWAPPHKVEGPDTEYTSFPHVMAALQAEGRSRPGSNQAEREFLKSLLYVQSKGVAVKLSEGVLAAAVRKSEDIKAVLISANVLMSDPSLVLALHSVNEQINQNLGVFGSADNLDANGYKFILVADEAGLKSMQDVDNFFAAVNEGALKGARLGREMFAKIITQDDMAEGDIADAAALLKHLERMGISPEEITGFLGDKTWVNSLKGQDEMGFIPAVGVIVEARDSEMAPAANGLYALLEASASSDKKIGDQSLAARLELTLNEVARIEVMPKKINPKIEKEIESYREVVHRV